MVCFQLALIWSEQGLDKETDLEVKDAGVVVLETLILRNHAGQDVLIQSQGGNRRQQPAVT